MRLFLILLTFTTFSFGQPPDTTTIEKLARDFGEAWLKGDTQTLDHLLAREYTHTDVTGRVLHRADWLADAANVQKWARSPGSQGNPTIEFYEMKTELRGDTAIITGGNIIRPAGSSTPLKLRFTQVWIKEDGQWKRSYFQATPIATEN